MHISWKQIGQKISKNREDLANMINKLAPRKNYAFLWSTHRTYIEIDVSETIKSVFYF